MTAHVTARTIRITFSPVLATFQPVATRSLVQVRNDSDQLIKDRLRPRVQRKMALSLEPHVRRAPDRPVCDSPPLRTNPIFLVADAVTLKKQRRFTCIS